MKNMKRKLQGFIGIALIIILTVTGCATSDEERAYKKAVKSLKETCVTNDGKYFVTEDLVFAVQNAEYTKPKNYIYMIGDGMGINIINATRQYYQDTDLYDNKLAIDYVPQVGWQSTYSADAQITDSAAGGTALATGYKTSNGTISMDKNDQRSFKTLLELADENGMSTGIIATKCVTDATPATFTAHVASRDMQEEIAAQQLQKMIDGSLDLVLGGGFLYFESSNNSALLNEAQENDVTYTQDWEETLEADMPILGLYEAENLNTYDMTKPSVAKMTEYALEQLSEDEDGFFLMVEGSQIDTKAHANSYYDEIKEMYDFDCAVAVALKFVAMNPDTVLVITADHETGGLHTVKEGAEALYSDYFYSTGNHTSIQVPVFAIGYGTEKLEGINDNTDVAAFIASLMGESDFGSKGELINLFDAQQSGALSLSFDEQHYQYELPLKDVATRIERIEHLRAVHMKVSNAGDDIVTLPSLILKGSSINATVDAQVDYLKPGEEVMLTYVLPYECWDSFATSTLKSCALSYEECTLVEWKNYLYDTTLEEAQLDITEIWVTNRGMED